MQTYRLKVDPEGRVAIPNAEPGQTIVVQVNVEMPSHLTFATATTPEEQAAVIADIKRLSGRLRSLLKDDLPLDPDELYGDDGLPA